MGARGLDDVLRGLGALFGLWVSQATLGVIGRLWVLGASMVTKGPRGALWVLGVSGQSPMSLRAFGASMVSLGASGSSLGARCHGALSGVTGSLRVLGPSRGLGALSGVFGRLRVLGASRGLVVLGEFPGVIGRLRVRGASGSSLVARGPLRGHWAPSGAWDLDGLPRGLGALFGGSVPWGTVGCHWAPSSGRGFGASMGARCRGALPGTFACPGPQWSLEGPQGSIRVLGAAGHARGSLGALGCSGPRGALWALGVSGVAGHLEVLGDLNGLWKLKNN